MGALALFNFVSLIYIIGFLYACLVGVAEVFIQHDIGNQTTSLSQATSICSEEVALAQTGSDSAFAKATEQDLCCSPGASLKRLQFPTHHRCYDGDFESTSVEMQCLQTTSQAQCDVLQHMSPAVAKCDRSFLCARSKAAAATGTDSSIPDPMARTTRLASPLEFYICSRQNSFTATETETTQCQGQQNTEEYTASNDTADTAHDDAGYAKSIHGSSFTNAHDVFSAANDVSNARSPTSLAATGCSLATIDRNTEHGQNASACAHIFGYAIAIDYANDASTSHAEDAGGSNAISGRDRRGGEGTYVHDERQTSRTAGRHAEEGAKSLDKVWTTGLHGPPCCCDGPGHCPQQLRRGCACQESTSCDVEKFLSDAVQLWQTYAAQFVDQERKLQEQVSLHKESLIAAKQDLEKSKVAKLGAGDVQHIASDEEAEDQDANTSSNAATKITETTQGLAKSLQSLHQEAEAMVAEEAHAAKRQKMMPPKDEDQPMNAGLGTGSHFGQAG